MKKLLFFLGCVILFSCNNDDKNPDPVEGQIINIKTFDKVLNAFGNGLSQSATGTFTFPADVEKIKKIKMFVQDFCPDRECDEWDRFANVYVKDKATGDWYEMGRFITPYWVGTEQLERGLEFDVTDFKSILSGTTELKIYTETWLSSGRTYSVDFDFEYGTPDYKYSAVVPVIQYNQSSIDGVPYGKEHTFDLSKQIILNSNIQKAYLRTIISGWGHATPNDAGGRGCAEWCFRTHHIAINNNSLFEHYLGPIGCANNPINNQNPGNWRSDRAGWCPGMVVPVRIDELQNSLFENAFTYEYQFEEWTNNGNNGEAYYAISTFVVVKSNSEIALPVVKD